MWRMGRLGEVEILLALFVLLGTLQGTSGQYDDYMTSEEYNEYKGYDYEEDEYYQEEDAVVLVESELVEATEGGEHRGDPEIGFPQNQELTPMCNNENCWIRVDWEPLPMDTRRSCILGYRVGYRKHSDECCDWTWINDEGTHIDVRSDKLFFFEEAEGTNHSLTIRNLDFETKYVVIIEVFNPYGASPPGPHYDVLTPPGS